MTALIPTSARIHRLRGAARAALGVLLALQALVACTDRDPVSAAPRELRAALTDGSGNSRLVVGMDDPRVTTLFVDISATDVRLSTRFPRAASGPIFGVVTVAPGADRRIRLRGTDAEGRVLYSGGTTVTVRQGMNPQTRFTLQPVDREHADLDGTQGWIGSYRVAVTPGTLGRPGKDPVSLTVTVRDPDGVRLPLREEDMLWSWPREVGRLDVVYSGRDAFEAYQASATWYWVDPRLDDEPDTDFVICLRPVATCSIIPWEPGAFVQYLEVDGGGRHTCALNSVSHAFCWGDNSRGQLGIENGTNHISGRIWKDISTGFEHTCAIDGLGYAWCWGNNGHEQLGRPATPTDLGGPKPTQVSQTLQFTQIAAGGHHTCALDTAGQIWCWGSWTFGQLGDGVWHPYTGGEQPQLVAGNLTWKAVSAGLNHSCGITTGGDVRCWGDNRAGQTMEIWIDGDMCPGNSTTGAMNIYCSREPGPSRVSGAIAISSGGDRNCALVTGGSIYCWGAYVVGDGSMTDNYQPQHVGSGTSFKAVGVGATQSCGVEASTSRIWCWGKNGHGQLGDGSYALALVPVMAAGTRAYGASLGLGDEHSCAVASNRRELLCWGNYLNGRLGHSASPVNVPQEVTVF